MRRVMTMLALTAFSVAACGGSNTPTTTSTAYKAAWIYVGSAADAGWTKAHDDGRLYVEQQLGSKIKTTFKENVPEGPQVAQVIDSLVADGNKIIFGTSFGFQDQMDAAAKKYPNVHSPKKEDICYATTNRQSAVKQLASHCDMVLVVGSQNRKLRVVPASALSSMTRR